jgi:hypothetical protein
MDEYVGFWVDRKGSGIEGWNGNGLGFGFGSGFGFGYGDGGGDGDGDGDGDGNGWSSLVSEYRYRGLRDLL